MSNFRFQDYVTSGAFTLSLARSQVMAMHRIASGSHHYACAATAALERKGLIVPVAAPEPASAIANLTNTRYWTGGEGAPMRITFVGLSHEVEIAAYLLAICERAMRTESAAMMHAVRRLPHIKQAARVMPFLDGMADRLAARIRAMIPPQPPGTGLVVLRNALITEELARRGIEIETGAARRPMTWGAYNEGLRAGDGVALNPGVAATSSARALR